MADISPLRPGATASTVAEGVEVRQGAKGATLRIQFVWRGKRRRESLKIPVTPANIRYASRLRGEVINAIERGTFDYARTFPNSKIGKAEARSEDATKTVETFGPILDSYLATLRASSKAGAVSPSTVATYAKWIRARIRPKFGGSSIGELSTAAMRKWIVELVEEGLAGKSIRNIVGVMSSVMSQAEADELVTKNPLAPISLKTLVPKRKRDGDDADPFNKDEIAAILAACDRPEDRALFQFLFSTGLRTGEAIALRWRRIDAARNIVHVADNVVEAEIGTAEKDDKTSSPRDVPLIPSAISALDVMRPISSGKSEYVFLSAEGQRWRNTQQIRSRWAIVLRKANVRYRVPYQTRHTFASTLLMAGESELLVARLLGHTTVEMVRRTYGRWIPQTGGIKLKSDYAGLGLPS